MQSKILFVDDEPGVLEALEVTFADEPYDCLTCRKPEQAMKLMEEKDFAVVVSDQRMDGVEGSEFLQKIKQQWPATVRILMTAYQEMNVVLDAINKGQVYNLIFKPWNEMELKGVIKNAVEDYNLRNISNSHRDLCQPLNHDINQLIEQNQELNEKNQYLMERLHQAQKMEALGNLAGGIAHDFNNVLLIINGCLDLAMSERCLTPKVGERLEQASKASKRARDLVSQILTFSNTNQSSDKPIKLGILVNEIVGFIQAALPSSIEIRKNITIGSEMVQLESTKVYQILMNLCTNAADALNGRHGSVLISLGRTRIDQPRKIGQKKLLPGSYFRLSVSDNGNGIGADNLDKIFNPYYTTKKKNGGTGLGLALINQIVEEHGGRITVESEVGKGTDFHVYLPLIDNTLYM